MMKTQAADIKIIVENARIVGNKVKIQETYYKIYAKINAIYHTHDWATDL